MRRVVSSLVGGLFAFGAAQAQADIVRLDDFRFTPSSSLTVSMPGYSGPAGMFTGVRNGESFLTFCTDLLQTFDFGVTYDNYSVVEGSVGFGAAKSLALDRTVSAFMASGAVADAEASAAAQAMIWEILYETDSHHDLTSGSFQATSSTRTSRAALIEMSEMAWSSAKLPVTHHVDRLYSPTNQDFLVVTGVNAVPEPSTIALLGAAAFGMLVVQRRTRRRP